MSIVNLKINKNSYSCLVCGNKDNLMELTIKRKRYEMGAIISFTICDNCIKQTSKELLDNIGL